MKRILLIFLVIALCLIVGIAAFFAGSQSAPSKESKGLAYAIPTLAPANSAGIPGITQNVLPSNVPSAALSSLQSLFSKNFTGYLYVDWAKGSTPLLETIWGNNFVLNCTPIVDFCFTQSVNSTATNKGTLFVSILADPQVVAYLPYIINNKISTNWAIFTSLPAYPDYYAHFSSPDAKISSFRLIGDYTGSQKAPIAEIQFDPGEIFLYFYNSTCSRYAGSSNQRVP
jgi:hypothetical protein